MAPERDQFANFERMRREIDELFGDVFERTGLRGRGFSPPVDVYYAKIRRELWCGPTWRGSTSATWRSRFAAASC